MTSSPADWKEVRLGEICEFVKTIALSRSQLEADHGVGCIHYGDIHTKFNDRLDCSNIRLPMAESGMVVGVPRLKVGDLVIADASEDMNGVGKGIEILGIPEYGVVAGLHTAVLRPQAGLFAKGFLGKLQHMPKFKEQARVLASGLKVYGLSKTSISKISVEIPPLKEQEAIAEALSDADAAIESLDALIAKKRDVKQATMQQLLSGRTRLPGFTADWNELELSKVAEIGPGINKALSEMGSGSLYVTVEDIYHGSFLDAGRLGRIRISKSEVERFSLQVGDLVLGKSSVKRDGIGYPNLFLGCAEPVVPSGFTYRVRPDKKVLNSAFLLQYLRSRPGRKWIIDNSQSSALTNINSSIVNRYPVIMPPLKEQEAIAEALTVMDDELGALTEQASKLRMVKQGMMQDLLTGKVRLV